MTIYQQGANIERLHCKNAIKRGALLSLRGAGSRSYGKYKIDTIDIFPDRIELVQHKKRGKMIKKDLVDLLELQKKVPNNVYVYVGDSKGIKLIEECIGDIFK